jgi:hypothetical protein
VAADHNVALVGVRNAAQPSVNLAPTVKAAQSASTRQTSLPQQPRPPSFFSYMFGGPAPINSSSGKTVGTYDHQAGRVGMEITGAYASIAEFLHPAGFLDSLLAGGGTKATRVVTRAIEEAIERHHPHPKFLGGPSKQELVDLAKSLHVDFHRRLAAALKEAGLLRVGGKGGGTQDWAAYFAKNTGSREQALGILRRVTREFDQTNGTSISKYLDDALGLGDDAIN